MFSIEAKEQRLNMPNTAHINILTNVFQRSQTPNIKDDKYYTYFKRTTVFYRSQMPKIKYDIYFTDKKNVQMFSIQAKYQGLNMRNTTQTHQKAKTQNKQRSTYYTYRFIKTYSARRTGQHACIC